MSTLASSPAPLPSWKQEVNRRLAEHKNRKGLSVVDENSPAEGQGTPNSRAAVAAARVAARYANAPSFSEMQAAEARGALRAAETATRVALEAEAAARAALDRFEAPDEREAQSPTYAVDAADSAGREARRPLESSASAVVENQDFEIRWEPDMPVIPAAPQQEPSQYANVIEDWLDSVARSAAPGYINEAVEGAQPIHANLIEFPRELIATRRMRPRLTEAYFGASDPNGQLSIFEVDPSTVSIDPGMPETSSAYPVPSWVGPEWSAIKLDAHPQEEQEYRYEPETRSDTRLHQAPFALRLMATVVDIAVIAGSVCGIFALAASSLPHLPSQKATEFCAVVTVIVMGVVYQALFLTLAKTTPGMRWAQLSLCTFDDEIPSPKQVRERLKAMAVSLLPVGLGLLWAIFDDDSLCWHDRLSRTYLRQS